MTHSIRLWFVIAALLAGALLIACGGNGDDDGGNGDAQPAATDAVDDDGAGDTGGDGDSNGGDSSGDLSEELRSLAEEFGIREVKIEYSFSSSAGGTADDEGSITLYWKPPDSWRTDISSASGEMILINSGDTSYLCSSENGGGQCLVSPIAQTIPIPFLSIFTEPEGLSDLIDTSLGDVDVERSDRTIAGQDASCFSLSGTIEGETGAAEYCFRNDGILLLLTVASGDAEEFSLEATGVEDSVSDSDLEPPYEVVDLGDLGDLAP